jgi:hypothetical protein
MLIQKDHLLMNIGNLIKMDNIIVLSADKIYLIHNKNSILHADGNK